MKTARPLTTGDMPNRDYYDEFAGWYEREREGGYHAMIDRIESSIARQFAVGKDVLEAGCGTGLILRDVAPVARRAVGIDLSAGMARQARARGLDVVQASVTALPFADASFDVVYSFKVLAHVEKIADAVAEMVRVTRPGGHLVLEFYNAWSLRYLVKRLKRPTAISDATHDHAVYTRYDTLADVERYLPPGVRVVGTRGVRVVTPAAVVFRARPVGKLLSFVEQKLSAAPVARRLGGFLVVVVEKPA